MEEDGYGRWEMDTVSYESEHTKDLGWRTWEKDTYKKEKWIHNTIGHGKRMVTMVGGRRALAEGYRWL